MTHSWVRMWMGYRTGTLAVAELSSRRPESSLSLHWGKGKGSIKRRAWPELHSSLRPGQGCWWGPAWACSPAHIGVQLDEVPPGAVQQRIKHHLDNNLAKEEKGMKKGGPEPQGAALAPHSPRAQPT